MCGIAGFIGAGNSDILTQMLQSISHRGPDDEGIYIKDFLYLGHKRLSIIDLSSNGRQPMCNEDSSLWIVFNGEIYNFLELKDSLSSCHQFKSKTDTEIILHLYEELGLEIFNRLNGMFSIAILDIPNYKLILARDRLGQKPIYYFHYETYFVFASEARAVIQHPFVRKALDTTSMVKFLFYEHVPAPDCIWQGIKKLLPGSFLQYDIYQNSLSTHQYWKSTFYPKLQISEGEIMNNLELFIESAVKRHLIADVPIGVYLSGGLDSSAVAYYAQRLLKGNLVTFTVAFDEPTYDEQHLARQTASMLGSKHYEVPFSADEFVNIAMNIIPKLDEPFADSSLIPAWHLNNFAKQHIKVALGGEGGDEIFIGYPIYQAHQVLRYFAKIPVALRKYLINPLINNLFCSYKNETWVYRLKKFIEADDFYHNPFYCQQIWLGAFGHTYLRHLIKDRELFQHSINKLFENIDIYRQMVDKDELLIDSLIRQTQMKYLTDDGLTKTDRASMLNSIETRAPLLDAELVDWVNKLPFSCKYKGVQTKRLIRKLMTYKLPLSVIKGKKKGFTPPIAKWFMLSLEQKVKDIIFSKDDFFDISYIERLWKEHRQHRQNHRKLLWTFFVWKLWHDKNITF